MKSGTPKTIAEAVARISELERALTDANAAAKTLRKELEPLRASNAALRDRVDVLSKEIQVAQTMASGRDGYARLMEQAKDAAVAVVRRKESEWVFLASQVRRIRALWLWNFLTLNWDAHEALVRTLNGKWAEGEGRASVEDVAAYKNRLAQRPKPRLGTSYARPSHVADDPSP